MAASTQFSDDSQCTDRSTWNIALSCFATIFACTWTAVHPNIPAPNESPIRVFGRRLAIMFYMLIAPELVIMWAVRQHLAASHIAKQYKAKGWTKTHAFFLIMGGFFLYEDGVPVRPLEAHEMEKLANARKIEWPTISEAEIMDKSKGDFFSKGVVIMQTTWFIIQCIARGSKRMVLTELEVVTLAFATLTMIIYGLWWNKPLGVRVSVPVHIKGYSADPGRKQEEKKRKTTPRSVAAVGEDDDSLQNSLLEVVERPETPIAVDVDVVTHSQTSLLGSKTPVALDVDIEAQDTNLSLSQQFRVYLRAKREKLGLIGSIIHVFMIRPISMFFRGFRDMMDCTTLESKIYRVPTFYAPAVVDGRMCFMLAMLVAIVFGGIHCIAWSFKFPTAIEKRAWRVSAVWVSGFPLSVLSYTVLGFLMRNSGGDGNSDTMGYYGSNPDALIYIFFFLYFFLSTLLYIAARGVLLILPLIGLRALPAGAYIDLNWTAYLPHI